MTDGATILIEVKHWKGKVKKEEMKPVISKLRKKCDMLNRMSVSIFQVGRRGDSTGGTDP